MHHASEFGLKPRDPRRRTAAQQLEDATAENIRDMLLACRNKLEHLDLRPWLEAHRYRGRTRSDYPRLGNERTIYEFHTNERREHAAGRRQRGEFSCCKRIQSDFRSNDMILSV
jgi:hypothetical protein